MIRTEHVQAYLERLRPERDELLAEMEALAERERVPIVEWETGRFLATLVRALDPQRVLEVGTAIGYSTVHIARELGANGRIITLERDPERIAAARGFWERDGIADRIELLEGDALESLRRLDGPFDIVFLDATKWEVGDYLDRLHGKFAERCVLLIDNLLMSGYVAVPDGRQTHWTPESLAAGRAAAQQLMASDEWLFSLLPIGDGVGFGVRR